MLNYNLFCFDELAKGFSEQIIFLIASVNKSFT